MTEGSEGGPGPEEPGVEVPHGGSLDAGNHGEKGFSSEDSPAGPKEEAVPPPPKEDHDDDDDDDDDEVAKPKNLESSASAFASTSADLPEAGDLPSASWGRQLRCILWKDCIQLSRRPITLFLLTTSSIISVILAWAAGKDVEYPLPPLTDCGTIPWDWYQNLTSTYPTPIYGSTSNIPLSLNESWRYGLPTAVMALGPMITAICVFLVVHGEMATRMVGVLRGLGLRDSVYWTAWFIPFAAMALVNSLLGAAVAQAMPVHVMQSTYFGGVFASLFFLQLALIPASFFLAAVCGSAKPAAPWLIVLMLLAVWVPQMTVGFSSGSVYISSYSGTQAPSGMFWLNQNTTYYDYSDPEGCQKPVLSERQGLWYKQTPEERFDITKDEYFVGCYATAGYFNSAYNNPEGVGGLVPLFMFPYFHFFGMWSNFLGFTGMPDRKFGIGESSMSPEALAVASLPSPPDPANGNGTTLYPQGSTLNIDSYYPQSNSCIQQPDGSWYCPTNCPDPDATDTDFCSSLSNCIHGAEPSPTTNSPSVNDEIGYLVLLAVIYSLLAGYWAQVFPCGNGAPQKFYFFLTKDYWCGQSNASSSASGDGDGSKGGGGVVVEGVRKKFGDFEAIKGVSLQMGRGEVTALLGHNGAGKTTLSNILTCELTPTEGDIFVYGNSVSTHPYAVRNMVGVCRQDDYLWADLSAREHLELFAGLRGVDNDALPDIVQKWLESVDLAEVQLGYASSFSGGMKRRLSVALATIGDRPLIVLDEPTTGMDPVSRRFVWRHIDDIKDGRVVLLTTHAMEEADLLADVVAIMRKGELAACGTPLQLKADHGSALQFTLLVEKADVADAERAILERFTAESSELINVTAGDAGNITVNIQRIQQSSDGDGVPVASLSDFVAWLDDSESGVLEYGFSNSSLEEVFLRVTVGDSDDEDDDDNDEDDVDVCCPCCCRCCIGCCLKGCCRCCCRPQPRIKEITDVPGEEDTKPETVVNASSQDVRASISSAAFKPMLTVRSQVRALLKLTFVRHWTGKSSIANYVMFIIFIIVTLIFGLMMDPKSETYPSLAIPVAFLSLMLISITGPMYTDRAEGLFFLQRTQGMLASSYLASTSLYSLLVQLAYGLVLLSLFYATPLFREPVLCTSSNGYCYHTTGDPPTYSYSQMSFVYSYQEEDVQVYAVRSAGSYGKIIGIVVLGAFAVSGGTLPSSFLPGRVFAMIALTFIVLLVSIAPLWLYFVYFSQDEKGEERFLQCEELLNPNDICEQTFTSSNVTTDFLNCVGASLSPAQVLCLPAYAAILSQFGLYQTLSLTLASDIKFFSQPPEYAEEVLIPSIQGGDCSGSTCKYPFAQQLYGENLGFMFVGAIATAILGVALAAFFAFPPGPVLRFKNKVSNFVESLRCRRRKKQGEELGDTKSGDPELEEVTKEREVVRQLVQPLLATPEPDALEAGSSEEADPIIVNHNDIPRDELPPVLMHKLRKVYPSLGGRPPKVALSSLSLHVPKGEVLGLLGKNGAGKTTALKILSAAHDASGGVALVAGYDVSCERISVFERLGNCPQFDVVWKNQSIQAHLEFFAMLKGLPKARVKEAAHFIATAVGLGAPEVYRRQAGSLSGGMRRRLSIAISLIGAPSVLVLDEPTTGLDPSTRNSIWGLVNSFATVERAVIITTHMMIEADTLCQRIAIVSKGELKVVATQQRLKNKYGTGYVLQLNLVRSTEAAQESAMSFVRKHLHKDAVLGIKQAKTLHIQLPRDLDLRKVFTALYSPESSSEGCINQFLLSQSSLEDVFIALGD